jgi:ATP-dependent Clp protease protease subunit
MAENKKFMDNKKISDVTLDQLMTEYLNNTSELKDLDNISERYDTINRVLLLNGIDEAVGDAITHLIRMWNMADKDIPVEERVPIKLFVDSSGGDLTSALMMADAITLSKTPVYTINMGTAYSGGLLVFVTGHKRYSFPSASFLFHEGSTSLGSIDAGKFKNYAGYYSNLIDRMKNYIIKNTKVDEELYKEKSCDDWWFFVDEAIELGFCDEIITEFI